LSLDSTFKSLFGKRHGAMVSFCSNYTPPVVISLWSVLHHKIQGKTVRNRFI